MNRRMTLMAAVAGVAMVAIAVAAVQISTGQQMTTAAIAFVDSLDEQQRETATMAFDNPDRLDWHFVPLSERKGLQIRDMTDQQREHAHRLLQAALSEIGYDKSVKIMQLESILAELENGGGAVRDPQRYYFTLFDAPAPEGKWGLSVEGHHLSLNFVVEDGKVIAHTPLFFGTNPATVRDEIEGGLAVGTRVLEDEEVLAFALLHELDDEQRGTAVIADEPLRDVRSAGEPQAPDAEPEGLAGSAMTNRQREILRELVEVYLANMPADVADARRAEVEEAGYEAIHFAWAGADEPGVGHYYRLQGPTFLVELANTQPDPSGRPANHVHALWRDVRGDFGIHR